MAKPPQWYNNDWGVGNFIRDNELSFHLGNAVKYIARAGKKPIEGQSLQYAYIKDLTKAIDYLQNELDNVAPIEHSNRVPQRFQDTQLFEWPNPPEEFDR